MLFGAVSKSAAPDYGPTTFHDAGNIESIQGRSYRDSIAFPKHCDEHGLINLTRSLGILAKPRNETTKGSGMSTIRYAPDPDGKGSSSTSTEAAAPLPPWTLATARKTRADSGGQLAARRRAPPDATAPRTRAAAAPRRRDLGRVPEIQGRRRRPALRWERWRRGWRVCGSPTLGALPP
ncbi:hypothetical protein DL769_009312 [Monosporascus sp. CRB-8-3]|nr:hypothetical protein DL769_009312 [Monosporascus sp. CRB-8-3]